MDREQIAAAIIQDDQAELENNQPKKVAKIGLQTDKDGHIKKNRSNWNRMLSYYDDKLSNLFRYNENTHFVEIIEDRSLHGKTILQKGMLTDSRINQIASYLSMTYNLDYQNTTVANEIDIVARENSYNPIKIFLREALEKSKLLDPFTIIQKYLSIDDTEYNRLVFDLVFRGAIGRVLEAGCQFDYCLDLTGVQGAGKTTFLREIFKGFYSEISSYTDKDDLMKMAESWAVNDDELVATRKTTFGELKQIITMREMQYRPPYGRSIERIPVDFIFTRTTNDFQHLKDATGDRRFLPVRVNKRKSGQPTRISEEDLLSLWGNYYRSYLKNKVLYYEEESPEGQIIEREREQYKVIDDDIERLEWYLSVLIPIDFYHSSTQNFQRRRYYQDLEQGRHSYKTDFDERTGKGWIGAEERDKATTTHIMEELFHSLPTSEQKKVKSKIRVYLNNSPNWENGKKFKIGGRTYVGWKKEGAEVEK